MRPSPPASRGDAARSPRTPLGCVEASFYAPGVKVCARCASLCLPSASRRACAHVAKAKKDLRRVERVIIAPRFADLRHTRLTLQLYSSTRLR